MAVTTVGVAPMMAVAIPVVDAAMPGFAALLATATPAPVVSAAVAMAHALPIGSPLALSMPLVPGVAARANQPATSIADGLPPLATPSSNPRATILPAPLGTLAQAKPLTAEAVTSAPAAVPRVIAQATPAAAAPLPRRITATDCAPLREAGPSPIDDRDNDHGAPDAAAIVATPLALVSSVLPAPPPRQPGNSLAATSATTAIRLEAAVTAAPARRQLSVLPILDAQISVMQTAVSPPTTRDAVDLRLPAAPARGAAPAALPMPAAMPVEPVMPAEQAIAFSATATASMSNTAAGASSPLPSVAASVVGPLAASLVVNASTAPPAAASVAAMVVAAPSRAGPVLREPRLPRPGEERDRFPAPAALPEPVPLRVALRVEPSVAGPSLPVAADAAPATAVDIAVASDRLGPVRIGIDGAPGDLRVSLGLSPAAAAIVAADAPRLMADLAANGARLQSLDISGGSFTGGQAPSPGQQQPQSPAPSMPRTVLPAAVNPVIAARASTADRYA